MNDPSNKVAEPQEEEVNIGIMQILLDRLTTIKPKYGLLVRKPLKGNLRT